MDCHVLLQCARYGSITGFPKDGSQGSPCILGGHFLLGGESQRAGRRQGLNLYILPHLAHPHRGYIPDGRLSVACGHTGMGKNVYARWRDLFGLGVCQVDGYAGRENLQYRVSEPETQMGGGCG